VRLGIGHPGDKRLVNPHVLGDFAKADAVWLAVLLRGMADGAPALAAGDQAGFLNAVQRRMAPPVARPEPEKAPRGVEAKEPDPRSALQKLVDRFR
jgi:PTH1 family peptidyl-tRNA hydrolase